MAFLVSRLCLRRSCCRGWLYRHSCCPCATFLQSWCCGLLLRLLGLPVPHRCHAGWL
ncbi:hypothetical protein DXA23_10245 [Phocaeicola vulgatus]|nr:hypothetical protein DXA23_10245 [Phocaeicola vulgatus]